MLETDGRHKAQPEREHVVAILKPAVLIVAANFKCELCFYLCAPFVSLFVDFLFVCSFGLRN